MNLAYYSIFTTCCLLVINSCTFPPGLGTPVPEEKSKNKTVSLPTPRLSGGMSIEDTLNRRRSVREYSEEAITLDEVSQLLWAAQGITSPDGYRTAPSAGALYPLELYLQAEKVSGLSPGVYKYNPQKHNLVSTVEEHPAAFLADAALQQPALKEAPIVIIITAIFERTTGKYGERGIRYVHMEVGHTAQNIYLQAESLDLGTVFIGAFYDDLVAERLQLDDGVQPLGLMPVGKK